MHDIYPKTILSAQNGMNLYRGCTHGCIYCDSRSECYQMNHAFTDVAVKRNAPALLYEALSRKRARCMIATGSMCDPYMPLEETERLTRQCEEIAARMGFGFTLITKSARVLRDIDVLTTINRETKCVVQMTLTTFDENLCRIVEPNVSTTRERVEALCQLRDAGIPCVVWLCPILPFLNDTEENLRGILQDCFDANVRGIICFGMGVTLRAGNREYFYQKLDEHFPGMKQRYLRAFGDAYVCASPNHDRLMRIFCDECEAHGVLYESDAVFSYLNRFEDRSQGEQGRLF